MGAELITVANDLADKKLRRVLSGFYHLSLSLPSQTFTNRDFFISMCYPQNFVCMSASPSQSDTVFCVSAHSSENIEKATSVRYLRCQRREVLPGGGPLTPLSARPGKPLLDEPVRASHPLQNFLTRNWRSCPSQYPIFTIPRRAHRLFRGLQGQLRAMYRVTGLMTRFTRSRSQRVASLLWFRITSASARNLI